MDPDLLVTVEVEVEPLPGQSLVTPKPSLGGREVPPDRIAKVRQIEPAEDAVPVRVVALRSPDGASSLGVVPLARQSEESACIFLCIRFDSEYFT